MTKRANRVKRCDVKAGRTFYMVLARELPLRLLTVTVVGPELKVNGYPPYRLFQFFEDGRKHVISRFLEDLEIGDPKYPTNHVFTSRREAKNRLFRTKAAAMKYVERLNLLYPKQGVSFSYFKTGNGTPPVGWPHNHKRDTAAIRTLHVGEPHDPLLLVIPYELNKASLDAALDETFALKP